MKTTKILYCDTFRKGFRKLSKKYPSLPKDFAVFLKWLEINPSGSFAHAVQINNLWDHMYLPMIKTKKFWLSCIKKTNSGIRIIYTYDPESTTYEFIEFIEIYHKNAQENHDIELIKKLYTGITNLPSGHANEESL
jgi:mRNA-degrading endonuclease RelE of RelBE toxin-antitoxin system